MEIGCVILAGGKSSRMGEDKALLQFEGKDFIKKIAEELSFFEEKLIARGNNSALLNLEEDFWKIIQDEYPDHGPIGGLHAVLKICRSEAMFCVSCDMPLITGELARAMCDVFREYQMRGESCDAVIGVASDGKYHPLCGIYRKGLWTQMEEEILQDNNRLMAVLGKCHVRYVELDEETSRQLTNVNTRKEYENLCN